MGGDSLLLNADGMPVSFLPLSTITWQDSIRYMVLDKADVLVWHDNWIVRSETWSTPVPSVIMLREYMKPKTAIRFSRSNLYLRDNGQCQYCGQEIERHVATLDHVLPVSKGGKTTWENSTTACAPCNALKADKTHMKPRSKPYKPDYYDLVGKRKKMQFSVQHKDWLEFL